MIAWLYGLVGMPSLHTLYHTLTSHEAEWLS